MRSFYPGILNCLSSVCTFPPAQNSVSVNTLISIITVHMVIIVTTVLIIALIIRPMRLTVAVVNIR
jgi:hypothetical protein